MVNAVISLRMYMQGNLVEIHTKRKLNNIPEPLDLINWFRLESLYGRVATP